MGRRQIGRVDEEFIDAFWEELTLCQKAWIVRVEVEILPTDRKGVLMIHLRAKEGAFSPAIAGVIARYSVEFPGPTARTMAATLYQAACKLDLMVQGVRAQQLERYEAQGG